jgi:hypothetical protein
MKKLSLYVLAAFMMFAVMPAQLHAATNPSATTIAAMKPVESEIADALNLRLIEIKELDKANLSAVEKKELRKEVRTIKSELKALNGGVYLSVGAILIIILLLILLL